MSGQIVLTGWKSETRAKAARAVIAVEVEPAAAGGLGRAIARATASQG
jgi:hypothetical protein